MKMLRTFKIDYEVYSTATKDRKKKFKKYYEMKKVIETLSKLEDNKELIQKAGEKIKALREDLKDEGTFYKVFISHKELKEVKEVTFDSRSDLTRGLKQECLNLIEEIKEVRKTRRKKISARKRFNGIFYYLTGKTHIKKGTILLLKDSRELVKFDEGKKPVTPENFVGVEVEVHLKATYDQVKSALFQYDKELVSKVQVKSDGSLRPIDGEIGLELAILDTEYHIADTVSKVIDALSDLNPRVDENCGLHVHLDMRNRIAETCFYNLYKAQNILYKMQAPSRAENRYCQKVQDDTIYKCIARNERYLGINPLALNNHETIEVRIHEGSFDKTQIINWIKTLAGIVNHQEKLEKSYRAGNSLSTDLGFSKELTDYIENRITEKAA